MVKITNDEKAHTLKMSTDENEKYEVFTQTQVISLINVLGDSPETHNYISYFDSVIAVNREIENDIPSMRLSKKQRRDVITEIQLASENLVSLLEKVNIKEGETITAEKNYQSFLDLQHGFVMSDLATHKNTSKEFVPQLLEDLRLLQHRCSESNEHIGTPKRGDSGWYEDALKKFDRSLVFHYRSTYRCFPAINKDGAFIKAVEIIYEAAGHPTTNIYSRMKKAIQNDKNIFQNKKATLEELKPKRHLHKKKGE